MEKVEEQTNINQLYLLVRAMIGSVKKRCSGEEFEQIEEIRQLAVKISESKDADFRRENLTILQNQLSKFGLEAKTKLDAMKSQIFVFEKGGDRINTKFEYSRLLRLTYMLQKIDKSVSQLVEIEAAQQNASEIEMQ